MGSHLASCGRDSLRLADGLLMGRKSLSAILERCDRLGIEVTDISSQYPFCDRKSSTLGFFDRRNGNLLAAFNRKNLAAMERFLENLAQR